MIGPRRNRDGGLARLRPVFILALVFGLLGIALCVRGCGR